jgi:WhiB family transcriptional regulator, redox-sensing transcriptional regulator
MREFDPALVAANRRAAVIHHARLALRQWIYDLTLITPAGPDHTPHGQEHWSHHAVCAETDPDVFYPESGEPVTEAKRVCARCPVTTPCLNWALANNERYGVWGGTSERERRRMTRVRKAAA